MQITDKDKFLFLQKAFATKMLFEAVKLSSDPYIENTLPHYFALGADVNASDEFGLTPLFYAPTLTTVKILCAYGAMVNAQAKKNHPQYLFSVGATPLHFAAIQKKFDVFTGLLNSRASLSILDQAWRTPLHYATLAPRNSAIVKFMCHINPNILNLPDISGGTPLMYAASVDVENTQALIEYGAKNNGRDCSGKCAVHYAQTSLVNQAYKEEIIALLNFTSFQLGQ